MGKIAEPDWPNIAASLRRTIALVVTQTEQALMESGGLTKDEDGDPVIALAPEDAECLATACSIAWALEREVKLQQKVEEDGFA